MSKSRIPDFCTFCHVFRLPAVVSCPLVGPFEANLPYNVARVGHCDVPMKPSDDTSSASPSLHFRVRMLRNDEIAIGPGKIDLLEAIASQGSIAAAARHMGMSYRRAWLLLDQMNRALQSPATVSAMGGQTGGGCVLTPIGEQIVRLYREIEQEARRATAPQIAALENLLKP